MILSGKISDHDVYVSRMKDFEGTTIFNRMEGQPEIHFIKSDKTDFSLTDKLHKLLKKMGPWGHFKDWHNSTV